VFRFVNISQARTEEILDERIAAEPLDRRALGPPDQRHPAGRRRRARGLRHRRGRVEVDAAYAVACAGARSDEIRRCSD